MNVICRCWTRAIALSLAVLFWGSFQAWAQDKPIRLRTETIHTPPRPLRVGPSLQAEERISGLYLLQCETRFQSTWDEALRSLGVARLVYVPDDTFIVRFDHASLAQVRALPFVRWVGEYRVDHKVHALVKSWWHEPAQGETRNLNLMISPLATPLERALVQKQFQRVHRQGNTRFAFMTQGTVHRSRILALLSSPVVLWVEPAPQPRLVDEVAARIVAGVGTTKPLYTQELGFDGTGVTVAVADSGLDTGDLQDLHPDIEGRVRSLLFYGDLTDASDGHSHGTHVTGIVAGGGKIPETDENGFLYGLGVAPGAQIVAQRIFDDAGGYQAPPSYETLTHDAVRAGADIGSNSWGDDTQGRYDISASEFDALVRDADSFTDGDQPYVLEFSAGNAGPGLQTVGSPAVGKNVIATGASESDRLDLFIYADGTNTMADFSSRGPCEDGRIKPDISAPGTWIASMKSRFATDENAWGSISPNYIYQGGTSQAGPQVSGAAAVFFQYYRELYGKKPSPALVKAALINSASDLDDSGGTSPTPNNDEGWGLVSLPNLIGPLARHTEFVDQSVTLTGGQVYEKRLVVVDSSEQLKITLAYTDVPGFPGAIPALVNDLDLEVVAPDGTLYRGNQFDEGDSVPNPPSADRVNNVEGVHLYEPLTGEYIVRVRAVNVAQDSRRDTPAVDQDFALVLSGPIPIPGAAAILLDRASYSAPSSIRVTVLDPARAGQSTVAVSVRSSTEPAGLTLNLKSSANSLVFTGAVATAKGPAAADAALQIAHADVITADYVSGATQLSKSAVADLKGPLITGVSSTPDLGAVEVTWQTDEPSTSVVYYGLTTPNVSASSRVLETDHALAVGGLAGGKTYKYFVVSIDEAGNASTNNNNGNFYTFVAPKLKTVLLVDAYEPDVFLDTAFIPLSSYTNALEAAKISYDVLDRSSGPAITADRLRSYRVVIWRINDMDLAASITATEVSVLTNFVAGGGGFFMASMEGLSRFANPAFEAGLAHVDSFVADVGAANILGASGDPVASGVSMQLNYANYPDLSDFGFGGPDFSDHLQPTSDAAALFFETVDNEPVGIRYPARLSADVSGRTVFLGFPLDAIPTSGVGANSRSGLLRNIISYLAPGADGIGTLALNDTRYSLPSRVDIELGDSDLAGAGTITVKASTDSDTTPINLTLSETPKAGVFKGSLTLVAVGETAGAGRLRAKEGDTVRVSYVDQTSGGGVVEVTAVIDTTPPTITTPPEAEPDYEDAVVSWSTSEPTDGLVEFGETKRLGRTTYAAGLAEDHTLSLRALAPDRQYYYRVTSRDQAGNVVQDDNNGEFYVFKTLKPLPVPWSDSMDSPDTLWTVFDAEGTQESWTRGIPNNGMETAAKSPPNAWGSILHGGIRDEVESYLISPSLNLTGGNIATLRFWHSYDFLQSSEFDILHGGEVLLITNNAATPTTLLTLGDETSHWLEEELDLTPYIGHVAYIVFHYVLFSFDSSPRPGWLIDDVQVEMQNVVLGTIDVTNNLAQARFTITGPKSVTGQGWSLHASDMPEGSYKITYQPVPYYTTPAPQSFDLTSGQQIVIQGNYTFTDANQNGISDAWEQQFFGAVGNHSASLDSDGDGMNDLNEFLAGTDPTKADSVLHLLAVRPAVDGSVQVSWTSSAGHSYRLLGSPDLLGWTATSEWITAGAGTAFFNVPKTGAAAVRFFRVEMRP